jgi:hypothetical protein
MTLHNWDAYNRQYRVKQNIKIKNAQNKYSSQTGNVSKLMEDQPMWINLSLSLSDNHIDTFINMSRFSTCYRDDHEHSKVVYW